MRRYSEFADAGSLFYNSDPAAVLTFYNSLTRSAHLEPEKRLMLALLDEALKCFRKHVRSKTRRGQRLFREVE